MPLTVNNIPNTSTTPRTSAEKAALDPKAQIYNLLKKSNEEAKKRKINSVKFEGVILYTGYMDYETFSSSYEAEFVKRIFNKPDKSTETPLIATSIVFIKDICSCLPAIKEKDFFEKLQSLSKENSSKPKKGNNFSRKLIDDLKNQLKIGNNSKFQEDFKRISRYPRAFCATNASMKPAVMDTVIVEFDRNYDFSKCKILRKTSSSNY